ncbi:MAG: hypothetical protein AAFO62_12120, partial [Pseudomonadota bacterium]
VIRARGPAAWDSRVVVSKQRKFRGVAGGGLDVLAQRIMQPSNPDALSREGLWTAPALGDATELPAGDLTPAPSLT